MAHLSLQVTALKQKIEQEQGAAFPATNLKLIYAGKLCILCTLRYNTQFAREVVSCLFSSAVRALVL